MSKPTGNNNIFPPPQGDHGIGSKTPNPYVTNKLGQIESRLSLVEEVLAKLLTEHKHSDLHIKQIPHTQQYRSIIYHDIAFIIDENRELKEKIKKLEHFRDTTVGLWATDKPDLIPDNLKDKYFLFEIKE